MDRRFRPRCRRAELRSKILPAGETAPVQDAPMVARVLDPPAGRRPSLLYTPVDIEWLNYHGEGKRRIADREPDFRNLSQILRTVGAYIDLRRMRLLALRRRGDQVFLRLQENDGSARLEKHSLVSFQRYFRFLYTRCRADVAAIEVGFQRRA